MAKKAKVKLKAPITTGKPAELGLKGKGVEALAIPEIDAAGDVYITARNERVACSEAEDDAKKTLLEAMHKHKVKLIQETGGGVSYRYGDKLITIAPTGEKLKVKSVHDEKAVEE